MEMRKRKADYYRCALAHPGIRHPEWREGIVPWRYTFLLESADQRRVTALLRSQGIDVSNWYPSLHRWYEHDTAAWMTYPGAEFVSARVMNFWVAPAYSQEEMERATKALLQILNQENGHA
jgi:dTDP-4-amino-4,6-dideoxygalactose transaminase